MITKLMIAKALANFFDKENDTDKSQKSLDDYIATIKSHSSTAFNPNNALDTLLTKIADAGVDNRTARACLDRLILALDKANKATPNKETASFRQAIKDFIKSPEAEQAREASSGIIAAPKG